MKDCFRCYALLIMRKLPRHWFCRLWQNISGCLVSFRNFFGVVFEVHCRLIGSFVLGELVVDWVNDLPRRYRWGSAGLLSGFLSRISAGLSFPAQLTMWSSPFQNTASSLITASLRTGQARDCILTVLRHLSRRSLFSLATAIDGDCTNRSKAKFVMYDSWYRVSSKVEKVSIFYKSM